MTPYLQILYDAAAIILFAGSTFYLAIGLYREARPIRGGADACRDNMLVSIALSMLALVLRSL